MPKKKPFVANKNHFFIFIGLFLCLITLILCLNTGPVARVLSTPFTYAFGSCSYLLYISFNLLVLRFIFVRKLLKIRINIYFFGTLLLLTAGMIFYAHFTYIFAPNDGKYLVLSGDNSFFTWYNSVMEMEGHYWTNFAPLGLLSSSFASGISGYFLVALFNTVFNISFGCAAPALSSGLRAVQAVYAKVEGTWLSAFSTLP